MGDRGQGGRSSLNQQKRSVTITSSGSRQRPTPPPSSPSVLNSVVSDLMRAAVGGVPSIVPDDDLQRYIAAKILEETAAAKKRYEHDGNNEHGGRIHEIVTSEAIRSTTLGHDHAEAAAQAVPGRKAVELDPHTQRIKRGRGAIGSSRLDKFFDDGYDPALDLDNYDDASLVHYVERLEELARKPRGGDESSRTAASSRDRPGRELDRDEKKEDRKRRKEKKEKKAKKEKKESNGKRDRERDTTSSRRRRRSRSLVSSSSSEDERERRGNRGREVTMHTQLSNVPRDLPTSCPW
ncbi:uncharacterized protein EV422DRAFT_569541 [Fimicolochytrium jonesii]|uniref:uncharacterized protein n=1 Tax=Fimicolochytrium jonesii TaxID=1396493 RepID=UPI0022FE7D05|nr:uncharacterized protein EV422DRAFT_569541 [Fimicolochytrium jonesii]KAI8818493.1 hypothetical protein EV422DRAFT_569541 [Fimicolochytrium jonesii]